MTGARNFTAVRIRIDEIFKGSNFLPMYVFLKSCSCSVGSNEEHVIQTSAMGFSRAIERQAGDGF